ncbi:PilW family protein [Coralloluteibacterium stylophorae]|uniref:PilW family protein n=1 Tax=Coralloluteibacterium stylophorae TaxID=1776034 RepID=A0A8J7VYV1_9GAMM|nr:PilW family protein [Coralloluteibacterium stylophorae]MBS7456664.1 PilW family protein [Coralloluteibacterium stylophorae]
MTGGRTKVRGVSLIELMIALLIGSLLLLGLVQIFSASRTSYQMSEGVARVQENARFAIDFLQRDIRMAGHFGCVNDQAHWVKGEGDPALHLGASLPLAHPLNFAVSVQGYEASGTAPGNSVQIGAAAGGWSPGLPTTISGLSPAAGSDIIVLRFLGSRAVPVTAIAGSAGAETLTIPTSTGIESLREEGVGEPDLFGVADCSHADVFPGAAADGAVTVGAAVPDTELTGRYTAHPAGQTAVYRAHSIVYYVAPGASGEPALWRAWANAAGAYPPGNREELVEGVESLQLLFGRDEEPVLDSSSPPRGNITVQGTAAAVVAGASTDAEVANEWRRVGQVQIGLLARSPARAAAMAATEGASPRVLGVVYTPAENNDARVRIAYETTVALRNRLFGN